MYVFLPGTIACHCGDKVALSRVFFNLFFLPLLIKTFEAKDV